MQRDETIEGWILLTGSALRLANFISSDRSVWGMLEKGDDKDGSKE